MTEVTDGEGCIRTASKPLPNGSSEPSPPLLPGWVRVRTDAGKTVTLTVDQARGAHRHFDLGYTVMSHSGRRLTADRVLLYIDRERAGSVW